MGDNLTKEQMEELQTKVNAKVREKRVVMLTKSGCKYCKKAAVVVQALIRDGILKQEEVLQWKVDDEEHTDSIMKVCEELTGDDTVPRVFINGEFWSGGTGMVESYESGELQAHLTGDESYKAGGHKLQGDDGEGGYGLGDAISDALWWS